MSLFTARLSPAAKCTETLRRPLTRLCSCAGGGLLRRPGCAFRQACSPLSARVCGPTSRLPPSLWPAGVSHVNGPAHRFGSRGPLFWGPVSEIRAEPSAVFSSDSCTIRSFTLRAGPVSNTLPFRIRCERSVCVQMAHRSHAIGWKDSTVVLERPPHAQWSERHLSASVTRWPISVLPLLPHRSACGLVMHLLLIAGAF